MLSKSLRLRINAEIEFRRRIELEGDLSFARYQSDPHGFCKDQFNEIYTDDIVAVMESVRDNIVTIVRSANATGKSHAAPRIATWFYKSFPGAKVFTTAAPPERNLETIIWGEMYGLASRHPKLFADDQITANMNIGRNKEEFITGVTIPVAGTAQTVEERFSGKHAPNMLFIVDEANAVPEAVFKGIESCMSGGNARLVLFFNPRGKYGPASKMETKGQGHVCQISAFNHPNVITGQNVIPGAVTRETTVRRINLWSRPLAPDEQKDIECYELPDFLVGESCVAANGEPYAPLPAGTRKVTEPSFFYMVLGEYPPQAERQLISRAWVDAAISRWLTYVAVNGEKPPTVTGIAGLDVAEFGKDWNILCYRFGGFVPRITDRWNGIDPDATAIKAAERVKNRDRKIKVKVDGTGLGSGVAPRMRRLGIVDSESIKVASSPTYTTELGDFDILREQLWWSTARWLEKDPGAMLPPDDELIEELCTPSYWVNLKGKIKITDKETMRELLGRSPDKADALNLTFAPDAQHGVSVQKYA